MRREQLKGHLNLLLLSVLAGGPAHGYAVIGALRERSAQEFTLPEGTVYPALHRLEQAGLLRSYWAEQAGRRRRLYELTARGKSQLAELNEYWKSLNTTVSQLGR